MTSLTSLATEVLSQVPNPAPAPPPGTSGLANDWVSYFKWFALVAGVIGLILCGIMMAIGRRNRSSMAADGAAGVPWVLGGLMLVSLSATIVAALV